MSDYVNPSAAVLEVDDDTSLIVVEVPAAFIVKFQGIIDSYEGIGAVRTLDRENNIICILTTPDMVETVLTVIHSIADEIPWRTVPGQSAEDGYRDIANRYLKALG